MFHSSFNPQALLEERLVIDYPISKVYAAVVSTARDGYGFSLREENKIMHRITVSTSVSMFSWGELMTIQLVDIDGRTQLTISSQLKTSIGSRAASTQTFIGRKNKKNIDTFLNEVSRHL